MAEKIQTGEIDWAKITKCRMQQTNTLRRN